MKSCPHPNPAPDAGFITPSQSWGIRERAAVVGRPASHILLPPRVGAPEKEQGWRCIPRKGRDPSPPAPREREEALRAPGGGDTPAPLRSVPRGKRPPSRVWGSWLDPRRRQAPSARLLLSLLRPGAPSGFPQALGAPGFPAPERACERTEWTAGGAGRRWECRSGGRGSCSSGAPRGSRCSPGGGGGGAAVRSGQRSHASLPISRSSDTPRSWPPLWRGGADD